MGRGESRKRGGVGGEKGRGHIVKSETENDRRELLIHINN